MLLTYLNGCSHNDRFFDVSLEMQRYHMALYLNLNPDTPDNWPMGLIDHLIGMRKHEGPERFYRELGAMLTRS